MPHLDRKINLQLSYLNHLGNKVCQVDCVSRFHNSQKMTDLLQIWTAKKRNHFFTRNLLSWSRTMQSLLFLVFFGERNENLHPRVVAMRVDSRIILENSAHRFLRTISHACRFVRNIVFPEILFAPNRKYPTIPTSNGPRKQHGNVPNHKRALAITEKGVGLMFRSCKCALRVISPTLSGCTILSGCRKFFCGEPFHMCDPIFFL